MGRIPSNAKTYPASSLSGARESERGKENNELFSLFWRVSSPEIPEIQELGTLNFELGFFIFFRRLIGKILGKLSSFVRLYLTDIIGWRTRVPT